MPATNNVEDRVKQIIVEQLGVDANEVTPQAHFVNDLGADSLDTVELVMALEEEFDTEIPMNKRRKFKRLAKPLNTLNLTLKSN